MRTRSTIAVVALVLLAGAPACFLPGAARAQAIRPWMPPSADSLQRWSSEAKVLFQANRGDSVGGPNFHAYELVGRMGRRLIRSLGKSGLLQAPAAEAIIDSLGLDVDVRVDPTFPDFVLLMVRDPYHRTAKAVGFFYWYRGDDLRMQGARYDGGHRPALRVWWAGYREQPYSLGVVDHEITTTGRIRVTLFRLNAAATALILVQPPDQGPDLEGGGEAAWADINADGRAELVAWVRAENDTLFESCLSCPYIIHEHTYTESISGMRLHDLRILPTPYSTFTLFIRQLADGNRAAAARLMRDPNRVDEAIAAGWGSRRRAKAWVLEYAEEERWPRWLAFMHHGPQGDQRYIVHFELKEGRWIIREWLKPHRVRGPGAPADSGAAGGTAKPKGSRPSARHARHAEPGRCAVSPLPMRRRPPATGSRDVVLATLAGLLIALAGCGRQPPRFVPPGADSTLAVMSDSFAVLVGDARDQWEAQDGPAAAPATARLLIDDLRRHPDRRMADRARTFLDSCGLSAEVAGSVDIAVANFFSRSDPAGGSWPYLIWRDGEVIRHQPVEGSGMRLLDLAAGPASGADPAAGPLQAAAIYARASSRGQQPVVIAWRRPPTGKRWSLAQTLGPDSLGGVGVVEFVVQAGGGTGIEARTYRPNAGFDECLTCPHIQRTLRFDWSVDGFHKVSEEAAPSPYQAFVQLIAALSVNDREMAQRLVADATLLDTAEQYEWGRSKGLWRVAPGADESATEMTFFRGRREAYKVRFAARDGRWMVTDFQPTQRSVE